MANFIPLKNYLLYCIDRLVEQYHCTAPFLDVGCGVGDVSKHFASNKWHGEAIDISSGAIEKARLNLAAFNSVKVTLGSLFEQKNVFNTIFLLDVLEHIEEDVSALQKVNELLNHNGHLILSVPSNAREWRWDDDLYGHGRRYDLKDIEGKLLRTGFLPLSCCDWTFPCFWFMRRVYTRLKSAPKANVLDNRTKTMESTLNNAWDIPIFSKMLSKNMFLWRLLYIIQFKFFKNKINNGHEMLIVALKTGNGQN